MDYNSAFADLIAEYCDVPESPLVGVFLLPNPWNFFPLNLIFGVFGWLLNLVFPVAWISWQWLASIWNLTFYALFAGIAVLLSVFVFTILLPVGWTFLVIIVILVLSFILLDGPVFIAIVLFIVSLLFFAGVTILFSPVLLILIGILVPFDKVFYLWVAITMFIVFWEIILPWFGLGYTDKEVVIEKTYDDSDEFQYTEYNF